jgi:hypothetical protein
MSIRTIQARPIDLFTQIKTSYEKKNTPILTIEQNWAFLDMQNLCKGVQAKGWKINWPNFKKYLSDTFNITRTFIFLGYLKERRNRYARLHNAGFDLIFREVKRLRDGSIDGGNVDADLAGYMMDYKGHYHQAIVIADDSDYTNTVLSLNRQNKLKLIISSHPVWNTSRLIKKAVERDQIMSIHSIRNIIEYTQPQINKMH